MRKILLSLAIIFISLLVLKIFVLTPQGWKAGLVNPMGYIFGNSVGTSTPIPTPNAPKTFQFDSSTDLKKELDSINPQVLDSDFEQ